MHPSGILLKSQKTWTRKKKCYTVICFLSLCSPFCSISADDALPNDPFMNYLLWPHFHFSGTFRSDVSTVNNHPSHYNTENFVAADLLQGPGNWNPKGSGEWSVTGSVTHVCYSNGHCVGEDEGDKDSEPLMGAMIQGANSIKCRLQRLLR